MDLNEIISEETLIVPENPKKKTIDKDKDEEVIESMREKLIGVALSGQCVKYLENEFTVFDFERMTTKNIKKFYGRYEKSLGKLVAEPLITHLISSVVHLLETSINPTNFEIRDKDQLEKKLTESISIAEMLKNATCILYYKYSWLLAPISAAAIISNHVVYVPPSKQLAPLPIKIESLPEGVDEID